MNKRSYILRIMNDHRTGKRLYDIISVYCLEPFGLTWHKDSFGMMNGYFELENETL